MQVQLKIIEVQYRLLGLDRNIGAVNPLYHYM